MKDLNVGNLIGNDIHQYPEMKNQYTAETSEKTKLIRIDKEGFNLYFKGFLESKYNKIINFLQSTGNLRRTRSNFN